MFERVAVIGAGAAGVAACWSAAQRGAEIRLFDDGVGASCLAGGAVDDRPWEEVARASEVLQIAPTARPMPELVVAFSAALGLWQLPLVGEPLVRLATEAGRIRLARGRDRSLLDFGSVPAGARIALPRVVRAEWDADSLARSLGADAYARSRRFRFEAVDAKLLKLVGENRVAPAEVASRHDSEERLAWLIERLAEMVAAQGQIDAILLGPWLGATQPLAESVSKALGLPVGEILSGVGSAAGMRFESARLQLLSSVGIELETKRVSAVTRRGSELIVQLEDEALAVDAVVLALGGLAAGGIVYRPAEQDAGQGIAPHACTPFHLSVRVPVRLAAHGRALDVGGSIHGPALDQLAWPTDADPGYLEAVGIASEASEAGPGVFVAGDVVADRPRTLLQAVHSGLRAGANAAGEPGSIRPPRPS